MGRRNKRYKKTLHQQAYERLQGMIAFGDSKHADMQTGDTKEKIYSYSTYRTYKIQINGFLKWVRQNHPDVTTLKSARKCVNEYLQECTDKGWSAWTISTANAALCKLFQISKDDPKRFHPPLRRREDIIRSRLPAKRDKHFSVTNNAPLIRFCKSTGCRRNVLQRLEGRDLWNRVQMEVKLHALSNKAHLSKEEARLQNTLQDALQSFPEENWFIHHRQDKGGRYRFAPIIGDGKEEVIARMQATPANSKVWQHVHDGGDYHGYRSDYAISLYRKYAREIKDIPYDRVNQGTGARYQSDVYYCRRDERGRHLDKRAMQKVSKGLGHNRLDVVIVYLRGF